MNRQHGLTLVELVIMMVIISIALVASLRAFSLLSGRSADALLQSRVTSLAQIYLDEILARQFDENTGPAGVPPYTGVCRITDDGENREQYDDVDDYNGLNESPALMDQDLAALYSGYQVSVEVHCDDSVGVNPGGAKRIDLAILAPNGQASHFTAYKGNF
ncbi:type IV pilus modification PilV family protein [Thalassolituus hydrocarboniclasticus]|uniref:Type II secretion system protein n=1 Tax=Thalassolituus hydrocarboniclasticus TaxID=2742796 RepID=A0ABY6A8A5_9GAMM|nr:type II secretion system protein [Thalassolituus hydrocarboniclasticus]UXD86564.1 type II secretion system protein [Thalassolituus hydrocarboniclasticus]